MNSSIGTTRFFVGTNTKCETLLHVFYSSYSSRPFSLLVNINTSKERITDVLSGDTKKGGEEIRKFRFRLVEKNNELQELELTRPDKNLINLAISLCESFTTEDEQKQNLIHLMKEHIVSTLENRNQIIDVIGVDYTRVPHEIKSYFPNIIKNQQIICGICDDIDNMRVNDYYNLNIKEDQKIIAFKCHSFPIAEEILKLLKNDNFNVIEFNEDTIKKSDIIFTTLNYEA